MLEDGSSTDYLQQFDGATSYSNLFDQNVAVDEANASKTIRYSALLADTPSAKIYMATAQPGYDERLIPGRTGRYMDRDSGNFYKGMLTAAVNSNPTWIVISTWNEFWENTYIEPSVLFGTQYCDITKQYSDAWKR